MARKRGPEIGTPLEEEAKTVKDIESLDHEIHVLLKEIKRQARSASARAFAGPAARRYSNDPRGGQSTTPYDHACRLADLHTGIRQAHAVLRRAADRAGIE